MEFEHLRTFADAAQSLSFSETAQRLHISQPTVSKHIKELESELGVILFDRISGGRLKLSQDGQSLLPWAQKLLRECNKFHEIAHSLNESVSGTLTIACATASGKYLLPLLAARFRTRFPQVHVKVKPCMPTQIGQDLLNQVIDFGIVSFENHVEGLECQKFIHDEVVLITPVHHRWAKRPAIEPDELLNEPMLLREPDSGTRRALASALAAHDISLEDLNILLELGNAEGIVHTVASGMGVAFVPRVTAQLALRAGYVHEIPVNGMRIERKICMLRNALRAPSRSAELFWGFIHDPENADLLDENTGGR